MARKKNTDLKLTQIKKKAKENNLTETYEFVDGTTLKFYPIFPQTLIEQMFEEIQSSFQTKPEELELNEKMTHSYILYMVIKHFTHLKEQFKAATLVEQLDELSSLVDSGYFEKIIEEVFLPQEISKIFDQLAKFGGRFLFLEKMTEKMHDEVGKLELQNKDIFEQFGKDRKQIPEA